MQKFNIQNIYFRLLILGIASVILVFILLFSIQKIGGNKFIWVEAENAKTIIKPLKIIEDSEASNGKAVENSDLPSHVVKAYIEFEPVIKEDGDYKFWARCKWKNQCANTFYLNINNENRIKFGEESMFDQWIWVSTWKIFKLTRGINKISIWNEEANTKIDRILLTTDHNYIPRGDGDLCNYYLNFADGKNMYLIPNYKDYWEVVNDSVKFSNNNSYYLKKIHDKKNVSSFISLKHSPKDFLFSANIRFSDEIDLIFNKREDDYYIVKLKNQKSELKNHSSIEELTLSIKNDSSDFNSYKNITILRFFPEILVLSDNKIVHRVTDSTLLYGDIGFSSTVGDLYVDDITYKIDLEPVYSNNFWFYKKNEGPMRYIGDWEYKFEGVQFMNGRTKEQNDNAFCYVNHRYIKNYAVTCAMQNFSSESGIVFYMQDENNYYLFKGSNNKIKLVKSENGELKTLASKEIGFRKDCWNKLSVTSLNSNIECYINNSRVISVTDSTFKEGMAGFWTNSKNQYNSFDDICIEPVSQFKKKLKNNIFEYNFIQQLYVAQDFSDWTMNSKDLLWGIWVHTIISQKKSFENLYMENIRNFKSDFKIYHYKRLPDDIDEYFLIKTLGKNPREIKCLIRNKSATLFINQKPIIGKSFISKRDETNFSYTDGQFKLSIGNNDILEYTPDIVIDSVKFGIGYCGPGNGKISNTKVIIEN